LAILHVGMDSQRKVKIATNTHMILRCKVTLVKYERQKKNNQQIKSKQFNLGLIVSSHLLFFFFFFFCSVTPTLTTQKQNG
jgi:hypothetical protein